MVKFKYLRCAHDSIFLPGLAFKAFFNFKDCGGKRSDALLLTLNKATSSLVVQWQTVCVDLIKWV